MGKPLPTPTEKIETSEETAIRVAHDINNQLAVILSYAERLERQAVAGELDKDKVLLAAQKIHATGKRISQVLKALRNVK